ncbi:MAG: antibiotic biosynthesis monooxygenase [Actinomycetota bacterium]
MFAVIYRWRVKPEKEQQFIEAWTEITKYYLTTFGALGSRLHRGSDGIFYAYAQWKFAENRTEAFQNAPKFEAGIKLKEAIIEILPEIRLEPLSDLLIFPNKK